MGSIVQAVHDRWTIEANYRDLKQVERVGEVQLRRVWSNVGAMHLGMWVHTLTELWAWGRPVEELSDRRDCSWDDASRRPSDAERRRALQRAMWQEEYRRLNIPEPLGEKIRPPHYRTAHHTPGRMTGPITGEVQRISDR